jgi:hypothetical protein
LLLRYERFHVVVLRTRSKAACYNNYKLELCSDKSAEEPVASVVQYVGASPSGKMSMTDLSQAGKHHFRAARGLQAHFHDTLFPRALVDVVEIAQAASRRTEGGTHSREALWASAFDAVTELIATGAEDTEQSAHTLPALELLEPLCVAVSPFMVASALRPKIVAGALGGRSCVVLEDSASKDPIGHSSRQAALTRATARALETLFAEDGVLFSTVCTGSHASAHPPPADAARRLLQPVLAHIGAASGVDTFTAAE